MANQRPISKEKPRIVPYSTWEKERRELLEQEKHLTRLRDALSEKRRTLPWVEVEKQYAFDGPSGKLSLVELFEGKSQLVVYHFMFAPDWKAGCTSCTFWGDSFNGAVVHLAARDTAFTAISRAPYARLRAYAERFGFTFRWVSSFESDFNAAFGVLFTPETVERREKAYNYGTFAPPATDMHGISVFARDGERVFHTYSTYGRGIDAVNVTYQLLDLVPKGRDDADDPMAWLKRRDEYTLDDAS